MHAASVILLCNMDYTYCLYAAFMYHKSAVVLKRNIFLVSLHCTRGDCLLPPCSMPSYLEQCNPQAHHVLHALLSNVLWCTEACSVACMQLMWSCAGYAPVKALLIGKRLCQMTKTALHLHHQVIACTLLQPLGYICSVACNFAQKSQCAPCFSLHHFFD